MLQVLLAHTPLYLLVINYKTGMTFLAAFAMGSDTSCAPGLKLVVEWYLVMAKICALAIWLWPVQNS